MDILSIVLYILSIAFAALHCFAAASQIKADKKPFLGALMIIGSLILAGAVICGIAKQQYDFIFALFGCGLICFTAVFNGLKSGNFHIQHHIVRIAVSVILITGFIFL